MGFSDFYHACVSSAKMDSQCDFSDFCYIVFVSAKLSKGW